MTIDFLHPYWLLAGLLAPLAWFLPHRVERRTLGVLRTSLFALTALALAGPVLVLPQRHLHEVLVVDRSASLDSSARTRADQLVESWQREVRDPRRATVIVLGDLTGPIAAPDYPIPVLHVADPLGSSPLSAALAAAERQIPAGATGVVTVISDGLATDRRWGAVVQRLIARAIPVTTYDLGRRNDLRMVRFTNRQPLRVGQTASLDVELTGLTSGVVVRLVDQNGHELARATPVAREETAVATLEFEPDTAGFLPLQAEVVSNSGPVPTERTLHRTFAVQPPLHLLYAGSRMQGGAAKLGTLLGRGFTVDDAGNAPLEPETNLSGYDLVFLDDRPAATLRPEFQSRLADAVFHEGLGLIVSGGKASFGAGGYQNTPVATLLPVDLEQRTEKRDPSTALAIIIDTSGSMMGTRIDLAKQVARLAVRRLKAHDRVGIVEFYGNKSWALPMQSAGNKIIIDRALGRMQAIGGTVLYPAIEEAYYGLKNVSARYKHVLILTDGGIEDADFESLIRLMARDGIATSAVLVGAGTNSQALIDFASWGHGRFYAAMDRYALPEVVLKQATTTNLPAYKAGEFALTSRGGSPWWSDIDRQSVPAVNGYVETRGRPGAEVLLEVAGTGDPVLTTWQNGLGRVTALATEPVGDGTASWARWSEYGRFLARVATRTAGDSAPFHFELLRTDARLTLRAHRNGGTFELVPQAALLDAAGQPERPVEFRRLSPDDFEAELPFEPAREARFTAQAIDPANGHAFGAAVRLVSDARADVAPERQVAPNAILDLAALARATGGIAVDATKSGALAATPTPPVSPTSIALVEIWPYVALLALLLYLAELTYRRWPRTR